jgi:2-polyprenyl-3-methyl-5-hydroxy-6-metoxy-1,4-benzoquinol methylase
VAQEIGLLEEITKDATCPDILATRLGLSKRGVSCILRCLQAAKILRKIDDDHYQIESEGLETFHRTMDVVSALVDAINDGIFDRVEEDGTLLGNAPDKLSQLGITESFKSKQILTAPGRRYFTPGQDSYVGNYVSYQWKLQEYLVSHLAEAIKTGKPILQNNPDFFDSLVSVLFPMHYEAAQQLADYVTSLEAVNTLLDIGAGSGVWSIPLAMQKSQLHVDALDFAPVLDTARVFTRRYGVESQYSFLSENCFVLEDWEPRPYDLIYMNYLTDGLSVTEIQRLLMACKKHLRPGGYLVVADMVALPDWAGPLRDVFFSVLMLCLTDYGATHLTTDYEMWCHNAGLDKLVWITIPASIAPILIAQKTQL